MLVGGVGKEFNCPRFYIGFGKNGLMIGPPRTVSQRQREHGRNSVKKIRARVTT